MKDLGALRHYLGVDFTCIADGMHLHQGKYIFDLLDEQGMLDYKPVSTPLPRFFDSTCYTLPL